MLIGLIMKKKIHRLERSVFFKFFIKWMCENPDVSTLLGWPAGTYSVSGCRKFIMTFDLCAWLNFDPI